MEAKAESEARARRLVARSVDIKLMLVKAIREKEAVESLFTGQIDSTNNELEFTREMVAELQRHNVELECSLEELRMGSMMQTHAAQGLYDELALHEQVKKVKVHSPVLKGQQVDKSVAHPEKKGYLDLYLSAGEWKESWVILKHGKLYIFEPDAEFATDVIAIENAPTIRDSTIEGPPRDDQSVGVGIRITLAAREVLLCAEDMLEANIWVAAIRSSTSYGTELDGPPAWVDDADAPACFNCGQAFSLFKRRHHCRSCGQVYCHTCCNQYADIPRLSTASQVRVCDVCASQNVAAQTEAIVSSSNENFDSISSHSWEDVE